MYAIKENTTLVGISELRTNFTKVLEAIGGNSKVLLEKRNKPLAVIVPIGKYNYMERIIEAVEDASLGYIAKERDLKSRRSDYIDIDTAIKRLKPKK